MRQISFAPLGVSTSLLGFGCASLGSRVSAREGLAALERAYAAGVSWFDVAPAYGDGLAEEILGKFLTSKRDQVIVCTKVGLLPIQVSAIRRFAKPVARKVVAYLPALRALVRGGQASFQTAPLTGTLILSSLRESLRRLQTDHVDVLALHDVAPSSFNRDDVLRALEDAVREGHAKTISAAGRLESGLQAVSSSSQVTTLQIANSPFEPNVARAQRALEGARQVAFVIHSVYERSVLRRMLQLLDSENVKKLQAAGYSGTLQEIVYAFLLDFAVASNFQGVTLLSMYRPRHLQWNIERVSEASGDSVLRLARQIVESGSGRDGV